MGTSDDIGVDGSGAVIGVAGDSSTGAGVSALQPGRHHAKCGRQGLCSRSGVATVTGTAASPKDSVPVRLPKVSATHRITAKSMMTALLQGARARVYVVAAVPNVSGNYFTIYLNQAVTISVGPTAWLMTGRPGRSGRGWARGPC